MNMIQHRPELEAPIGALCGLARALISNDKTEETDRVVIESLEALYRDQDTDYEAIADRIREEKFHITPSCRTCETPCGNTSDYDFQEYYEAEEEVQRAKDILIDAVITAGHDLYAMKSDKTKPAEKTEEKTKLLYRGITFIAYNMDAETLDNLTQKLLTV